MSEHPSAKECVLLAEGSYCPKPSYFKSWTVIGPAFTGDLTKAHIFEDAEAAFNHPAYYFPRAPVSIVNLRELRNAESAKATGAAPQ
jgi:hypothetical protein